MRGSTVCCARKCTIVACGTLICTSIITNLQCVGIRTSGAASRIGYRTTCPYLRPHCTTGDWAGQEQTTNQIRKKLFHVDTPHLSGISGTRARTASLGLYNTFFFSGLSRGSGKYFECGIRVFRRINDKRYNKRIDQPFGGTAPYAGYPFIRQPA